MLQKEVQEVINEHPRALKASFRDYFPESDHNKHSNVGIYNLYLLLTLIDIIGSCDSTFIEQHNFFCIFTCIF